MTKCRKTSQNINASNSVKEMAADYMRLISGQGFQRAYLAA
jgi:hypothetical protein